MQAIRLNVKKQKRELKTEEVVDLDEKIRRIREQNKAREKRFKEIEDDKLNAETTASNIDGENHGKETNGGFQERKITKGRGQRLLEMTKEPLKAKSFQLRTFHRSSLNGTKGKIKRDRKFGKFKIWKRNEEESPIEKDGYDKNMMNHSTEDKSMDKGLLKTAELKDGRFDDDDNDKNESTSLSVSDEGIDINTSELLEDDSQGNITNIIGEETNEHDIFDEEQHESHKKQPTITINTKLTKSVSTSSFDEAIMLMSPLHVPANWGDCEFEENDDYFNKPIKF